MPKPKYRQPFGLPRHWRCLISQHFSMSLKPCLRPFSLSEGHTSFLAGRLHPERDRRLVELQLLRSIAWKRRSSGSTAPQPPRRAPKPKSSPKYAATSSKALPSKLAAAILLLFRPEIALFGPLVAPARHNRHLSAMVI